MTHVCDQSHPLSMCTHPIKTQQKSAINLAAEPVAPHPDGMCDQCSVFCATPKTLACILGVRFRDDFRPLVLSHFHHKVFRRLLKQQIFLSRSAMDRWIQRNCLREEFAVSPWASDPRSHVHFSDIDYCFDRCIRFRDQGNNAM